MAGANPAAPAYGEEIIPGAPKREVKINMLPHRNMLYQSNIKWLH
jgi:hypothetical protein